jgi:hypothetical protein
LCSVLEDMISTAWVLFLYPFVKVHVFMLAQTGSGVHLASYPMVTGGSFPGGKVAGREANRLPPSSAEVKNGGAILPLPHTYSWHNA